MSPGNRYLPEASMIRAPRGTGTAPRRPADFIESPSMITTESASGGLPVQSIRVAPAITVTLVMAWLAEPADVATMIIDKTISAPRANIAIQYSVLSSSVLSLLAARLKPPQINAWTQNSAKQRSLTLVAKILCLPSPQQCW